MVVHFYMALVRPHIDCCVQFGTLTSKEGIELLKRVQGRTMILVKGLENMTYGEWMRKLKPFSLEERMQRGDLITLYNFLKRGCSEEGAGLFSGDLLKCKETDSACTREGLD